jgi:tetratricopeptide (TPR) repeat protein
MKRTFQDPPFARRAVRALFCALALVFAVPASARADARGEAKRHFREGMALIAAGRLERGILELQQAYAIKPHRDLLYNIARAYLDLGRIPEALEYFQKYVATDPSDRAQVELVMARLSAATAPRPAPAPTAPAPSVDTAKLVAALQELIERNKAAAATAKPAAAKSKEEEGMFEPTAITAETRATAQEIASSLQAGRTDEGMFDEQTVTVGPPAVVAADAQTFQCAASSSGSETSCSCWWTEGACGDAASVNVSGRCSTCRCTTSRASK